MSASWTCGRYTVVLREHPPQAPSYTVMRAGKVVGASASLPNADQCESIERFEQTGRYADSPVQKYTYRLRGVAVQHRVRPSTSSAGKEKE